MYRIVPCWFLALLLGASVVSARAERIRDDVVENQNEAFRQYFEADVVWRFDDLPTKGKVPEYRVPWSGYIYPDRAGGTVGAMQKYDRAFGGSSATAWERWDARAHKDRGPGLFGRGVLALNVVPRWSGHCNGWTAAAIRHAEPASNVVRNGVVFSPADIKGLLAELYIYSQTELLAGAYSVANPGAVHVALGNWLGIGSHPVAMESAVGKEVWNYPIYSYASRATKRDSRHVDVRTTLTYSYMAGREYNKAPKLPRTMNLHYSLELDADGKIIGGHYYGDSHRLDLLWVPLRPTQGGTAGNESGNPHLDVGRVLAIWRESAPEDVRGKWLNIDPTEEDRVLPDEPEEDEPVEDEAAAAEEEPGT